MIDRHSKEPVSGALVCLFQEYYAGTSFSVESFLSGENHFKKRILLDTDREGRFRTKGVFLPPGDRKRLRLQGSMGIYHPEYVPYQKAIWGDEDWLLTEFSLVPLEQNVALKQGSENVIGPIRWTLATDVYVGFLNGGINVEPDKADLVFHFRKLQDGERLDPKRSTLSQMMIDGSGSSGGQKVLWKIESLGLGGIAPMPDEHANSFRELERCDGAKFDSAFETVSSSPATGKTSLFCLRTADGKYYAKMHFIMGLLDWVLQPNGTGDMRTIVTEETANPCRSFSEKDRESR